MPDLVVEPDKDNTLFEDPNGALSGGLGEFLFAGVTDQDVLRRALIRFNVAAAGIPAGATLDSVKLRLVMSRTIVGAFTVRLHRVLADWGEGSSNPGAQEGTGAPSEPGDATWIHTFFDTALWATPGGDFDAQASASRTVGENGTYTWGSTAQMVADVQSWIDDPANNFGWIVIGDETASRTAKRFDSRQRPAATRPKLLLFYTEP
jgi:hypothetical protein